MQKGRAGGVFLCLAMVFIFGFVGEVSAFEALGGKLRVNGFFKQEVGARLTEHVWVDDLIEKGNRFGNIAEEIFIGGEKFGPDIPARQNIDTYGIEYYTNAKQDDYTMSTCRSNLQVSIGYDITRDLLAKVVTRTYYDAKYDLYRGTPSKGEWGINADDEDWFAFGGNAEHMEADVDLREYHLTWYIGDFKITAGRQQIVWSEADAIRIADSINPIAVERDFSTTAYALAWEDIRIPLRLVNIVYTVPDSKYQHEIEAVINPEDFRPNTLAPYGETFHLVPHNLYSSYMPFDEALYQMGNFYGRKGYGPDETGNWTLTSVPDTPQHGYERLTTLSLSDALENVIDEGYDKASEHCFQLAVRLRGVYGGWDIHPIYTYQRVQNPVLTASKYFPGELYLPFFMIESGETRRRAFPMYGLDDDFAVKAHFPRIHTFGATGNYFHAGSGTVLRLEASYTPDHPFTGLRQGVADPVQINPEIRDDSYYPGDSSTQAVINPFGIDSPSGGADYDDWTFSERFDCSWEGWFDNEIHYRDVVQYMIGFDRPTWIPFLNPQATFFITGQFYHKIVLDYDDDNHDDVTPYSAPNYVNDQKWTGPIQLSTMMGKNQEANHMYLCSLKIDTHYLQDVIHPDLLMVWDCNAQAGFIRPAIKYQPNYQTRIEIGGLYVSNSGEGNYLAGPFGPIQDADLLYITYEYKF